MTSVGDVNEDLRSVGFQLERFGMCSQFDVAYAFFAGGIDDANCSASISNVKPLFDWVISQVVRIRLKIDYDRRMIRIGIEEANRAIFAASNCNQFEVLKESYSLRFAKTSDAVHYFLRFQVDHFNRVIAQGSHEESLARNIQG